MSTSITILQPGRPEVQAILLRGHVRLFQSGMRHSRMTQQQLLHKVGVLTGGTYPNSKKGLGLALNDLTAIVDCYPQAAANAAAIKEAGQ